MEDENEIKDVGMENLPEEELEDGLGDELGDGEDLDLSSEEEDGLGNESGDGDNW